jgi:hypothetical protein
MRTLVRLTASAAFARVSRASPARLFVSTRISVAAVILVAAGLLPSCGLTSSGKAESPSSRREELNHGYGLLYDAASGLRQLDKILYVKFESDPVERIIGEISKHAAKVARDLEKLAKKDEIRIEDTGLPEMERRTRDSVRRERFKSLAPLVGMSGKDFERTLLLTQSGALNQQRHLSKSLIDAETDPERKRFLRGVHRGYDRIYRKLVKLLDEQYFCNVVPRGGSGAHTETPEQ